MSEYEEAVPCETEDQEVVASNEAEFGGAVELLRESIELLEALDHSPKTRDALAYLNAGLKRLEGP